MKQCILRRALSALLCLVLALSLTACGGETERPETEGGSGMTGALSGGKGNVSEPKDDPEKAEAGLVLLRACMAEDDQLAGAVAYLGQREPNDRSSKTVAILFPSCRSCWRSQRSAYSAERAASSTASSPGTRAPVSL